MKKREKEKINNIVTYILFLSIGSVVAYIISIAMYSPYAQGLITDTSNYEIQESDLIGVAKECDKLDLGTRKVECVRDWIQERFIFDLQYLLPEAQFPLKTINEGGDCDDYIILFKEISKHMKDIHVIPQDFFYSDSNIGHTIGIVHGDWGYCIIEVIDTNPIYMPVYCRNRQKDLNITKE